MFTPGVAEIVVGKGLIAQFEGFDLGATIRLGKADWKIVGVFDAGGSAFESELWADIALLQSVYNRSSSVQSVRMKLDCAGVKVSLRRRVPDDSAIFHHHIPITGRLGDGDLANGPGGDGFVEFADAILKSRQREDRKRI